MSDNKEPKEPNDFILGLLAFIAIPAAIFLILGIAKVSDTGWGIPLGIISIFVIVGLLSRKD